MDAAEYKHIVLGLIFLKYISNTFTARRDELTRRFVDKTDDYFLPDADAAMLAEELEDRDYYKEANVFWVPEGARWEALRAAAKQTDIGKRIDIRLNSKMFFFKRIPTCEVSYISAFIKTIYRQKNRTI